MQKFLAVFFALGLSVLSGCSQEPGDGSNYSISIQGDPDKHLSGAQSAAPANKNKSQSDATSPAHISGAQKLDDSGSHVSGN